MGVPHAHLVEGDPHAAGRIAAEVLVGEEEHATSTGEGPVEHGAGVARRADDAAVAAAEGLQAGSRVDVGDRRDVGGVDHGAEIGPGVFHLLDARHVGHRAAGCHVGEHHGHPPPASGHLLGPVDEDVGRLSHEVDAAEGDRLAAVPFGGRLGELVAVALEVGMGDDAILLVVVTEDDQPRPHSLPHRLDSLAEHGIVEAAVGGKRAGQGEVGDGRRHGGAGSEGLTEYRTNRPPLCQWPDTLYCRRTRRTLRRSDQTG